MWPAFDKVYSPEREIRMQQAVVKPSWPCATSALLRPKRISPGVMRGLATKSAEDHRHPHGRSQTLSGDIADNGNEGAVWCRGNEEEVATDLTSREVDRFHLEARRGA